MDINAAIRRNRERDIRLHLNAAAKATAQGNRYRKQADAIRRDPSPYLDPQGEVRFLLACAEPFNREANDRRAKADALQAKLDAHV